VSQGPAGSLRPPAVGGDGRLSSDGPVKGQPTAGEAVAELVGRLSALRSALAAPSEGQLPAVATALPTPTLVRGTAAPADVLVAPSPAAALKSSTCPVCAAIRRSTFDFLCHWQYALATDKASRLSHRADGGFCRRHTWELEAVASPLGICVGYPTLVERFAEEAAGLAGLPATAAAVRLGTILPDASCRLCALEREASRTALDLLVGDDRATGGGSY